MCHINPANDLWFTNNLVSIAVAQADNADGLSVLVLQAPFDEAPPLHVHHHEDEIFHILEGEIRYQVGNDTLVKHQGDTLLAPRGVPHGFRVISPDGAKILTITRGGFETVVRTMSRPANTSGLPAPAPLTPDVQASLAAQCLEHGIELLGPPIA